MAKEETIDLSGYKAGVSPTLKATLTLDRDLIFVGRTPRGYEIDYDAEVEWGCMPTESLLLSIASCLAIDVVSFLRKMRADISSFWIEATAERNTTPPQYFKAVRMVIHVHGKGITEKKIDRCISLSREKYCSVQNTLRDDLTMDISYEITHEDE